MYLGIKASFGKGIDFLDRLTILIVFTSQFIDGAVVSKTEYFFHSFLYSYHSFSSQWLRQRFSRRNLKILGWETETQPNRQGGRPHTVTWVSLKPDRIPLMYGCALMCWGPGTISNSRVDNGSPWQTLV